MHARVAYAAIVVALVVLSALLCRAAAARQEAFISGLWVGETQFLAEAKLRDFQLFLAPPDGGAERARQGYLIMTDLAGGFVANCAITLAEGPAPLRLWAAVRGTFDPRGVYKDPRARLTFDAEGAAPPLPAELTLVTELTGGTLALCDGGKLYAFLAKDHDASAAALAAWED